MRKRIILLVLIFTISILLLATFTKVKADDTNLDPFTYWYDHDTGIPFMPNPPYDYAEVSYSVLHDGNPSLKVNGWHDGTTDATIGETEGLWVAVSPTAPFNHVVVSMWVKTEVFSGTSLQGGAGIGFDFLGTGLLLNGTTLHSILGTSGGFSGMQAGHPTGAERAYGNASAYGYTINGENGMTQESGLICKIPYGISTWTYCSFNFYVPSQTFNYIWDEKGGDECYPTHIDYMVLWTFVDDGGTAYFSEPYLAIDPSETTPTPTPTATVTPTATPTATATATPTGTFSTTLPTGFSEVQTGSSDPYMLIIGSIGGILTLMAIVLIVEKLQLLQQATGGLI